MATGRGAMSGPGSPGPPPDRDEGHRLLPRFRRALDRLAPWGTRRRSLLLAPARAIRIGQRHGWPALLGRVLRVWRWIPRLWAPAIPSAERLTPEERYDLWLRLTVLSGAPRRRMRREARRLRYRPLISVVVPVHDPEPGWLRAAIDSVRGQTYENWELCLADDGSTREDVRRLLAAADRSDSRIRLRSDDRNRGIAEASSAALG